MTKQRTYVISGGGTGGHIYPALAVADTIRQHQPQSRIHFIGTLRGLENKVVPDHGYKLHLIAVRGVARNRIRENLTVPFRLLVSLLQSRRLLKKLDPDIVIGTGGYVSGPVLYMAQLMNIPTLLQEQNSYPGVTTRLLAKRADRVHLTFESSLNWLKRHDNCCITGNPVRQPSRLSVTDARRQFGLDPEKRTLLIFGGSQGAHAVNAAVLQIIDRLLERDVQIIWGTGRQDESAVKAAVSDQRVWSNAYIDNMPDAYRAADLAVTRAGAITLAELTANHLPSILVPYPFAADNHQLKNAEALADKGAACVVEQKNLQHDAFYQIITDLLNNEKQRKTMTKRAAEMAFPDAANDLYVSIQEVQKP